MGTRSNKPKNIERLFDGVNDHHWFAFLNIFVRVIPYLDCVIRDESIHNLAYAKFDLWGSALSFCLQLVRLSNGRCLSYIMLPSSKSSVFVEQNLNEELNKTLAPEFKVTNPAHCRSAKYEILVDYLCILESVYNKFSFIRVYLDMLISIFLYFLF